MEEYEHQSAELFRLMDRVRRAWHGVTPCSHLSKSQFGTLLVIHRHEHLAEDGICTPEAHPIRLSALAGAMHQSLPALSQRMRALEELGYIERVPDPEDRRSIGVRLTDEGSGELALARERFSGILDRAMELMGPESARQLAPLLNQLAEALETAVAEQERSA